MSSVSTLMATAPGGSSLLVVL